MQYDELFNFQDHFIRQLRISRVEMLNVCVIIVSYSLSMYIALADGNSGNVTRASHTCESHVHMRVTRARGSHTCTWESHVHARA